MDIMLVVRVPVLSEQITEVHPRVSTEGRDRTMAFYANPPFNKKKGTIDR
jgi:hypothetical protein